jgi:hypothetical protein
MMMLAEDDGAVEMKNSPITCEFNSSPSIAVAVRFHQEFHTLF